MYKMLFTFLCLVFLLFQPIECLSNMSMDEINQILKSADMARGNNNGIHWNVKIDSIENGRSLKSRTMNLQVRGINSLGEYISPSRIKGQKILIKDRNMWFKKPGLRKPVSISPRQKLMGNAANGDIASTNYAGDYKASLISESVDLNGLNCYLFDLKSQDKKTTYDRIKYWVSHQDQVGVKAEFYTISGKLIKTATFKYKNMLEIKGKKHPFVSEMIICDAIVKNNITKMSYSNVSIKKISNSIFNRNLF